MAYPRHNPLALIDPKLSVVIPVYNERATIDEILRRVIETEPRKEIILVDDCSTDGTRHGRCRYHPASRYSDFFSN